MLQLDEVATPTPTKFGLMIKGTAGMPTMEKSSFPSG